MFANFLWPFKSADGKQNNCFVSGQAHRLIKRPVLSGTVSAFSQFPLENNWVNQIQGVASSSKAKCNPPVLKYRCANDKICEHHVLQAGNIAPYGQHGGAYCGCGGAYWKPDQTTLTFPYTNSCSTSISYRQILDERKLKSGCACGRC